MPLGANDNIYFFAEFMVAAPQYPNEAPPPYPGDEPALRLTDKQSLPPPSVQVENETRQETNIDSQHNDVHVDRGRAGVAHCTNPDRTSTESFSTSEGSSLRSAVIPHPHHPSTTTTPRSCRSEPDSSSRPSSNVLPSTSHQGRYQIPKYHPSGKSKAVRSQRSHRPRHLYGSYDSRSLSSTDSDSCTG